MSVFCCNSVVVRVIVLFVSVAVDAVDTRPSPPVLGSVSVLDALG